MAHMALTLTFHLGGNVQAEGTGRQQMPDAQTTVRLFNPGNTGMPSLPMPAGAAARKNATMAAEATHGLPAESALVEIAKPLEPYYFRTSELTAKPFVLQDIPVELNLPDVPPQRAAFRLFLNEYGDVDRVLVETSGLSEWGERFLTDVFYGTKFYPGKIDGIPVKSQIRIEMSIEEAAPAPSGTTSTAAGKTL